MVLAEKLRAETILYAEAWNIVYALAKTYTASALGVNLRICDCDCAY